MKQGFYKVEGGNSKILWALNIQQGEDVYIEKSEYKEPCACCGKVTEWTITGEYEGYIGTTCMKKLNLKSL